MAGGRYGYRGYWALLPSLPLLDFLQPAFYRFFRALVRRMIILPSSQGVRQALHPGYLFLCIMGIHIAVAIMQILSLIHI